MPSMASDSQIRALIVDDESPARSRIRQLLRDEADFKIIGECANGREAIETIKQQKPDVVFLDVQMPGLSGVDFCPVISADSNPPPLLVFVTAYDQFAVKAFEVHAIDYLLKPFDRERFKQALC